MTELKIGDLVRLVDASANKALPPAGSIGVVVGRSILTRSMSVKVRFYEGTYRPNKSFLANRFERVTLDE